MPKDKTLPDDWGKDSLSEFYDDAHHNTLATFANLKPEYKRLRVINDAFKTITENLHNIGELIPAFFLLRAHSSYMGATRLAVSGQIPEAYMVLRGCLENSLYALHIYRTPGLSNIWFKRHENEDTLKKCKDCFKSINVFKTLETEDKKLHKITRDLYETTIDYGGHPNEASLTSIMKQSENESQLQFTVPYLTSYKINKAAFLLCLKSCARIGVCSLFIFKLIFRHRFDILGISNMLPKLSAGL